MLIKAFIQKYWGNGVMILAIVLLLLNPDVKVWVLQRLMDIGLFGAPAHEEKPETLTRNKIQNLLFTGTDNKIISTDELKGKVVFINFWATWCPPCLAEMPSVNALWLKLQPDARFVFIIADADGNFETSIPFMQANNYSLPLYKPAGAIPANIFGGTLPTTIIIDPTGKIVNRNQGIENYDTPEMVNYLKGLLNKPGI